MKSKLLKSDEFFEPLKKALVGKTIIDVTMDLTRYTLVFDDGQLLHIPADKHHQYVHTK